MPACAARGAPLLCSVRHAQLVPHRPWAETNGPNPPPPPNGPCGVSTCQDMRIWHQRMGAGHVMVLVLHSQNTQLEEAFFLKHFVPSCWGSRCQVGHFKRIQRWWAWGCGEQFLFNLDLWTNVCVCIIYRDFHRWQLFFFQCGWSHDCSEMSLATVVLLGWIIWLLFCCFGLVVENQ